MFSFYDPPVTAAIGVCLLGIGLPLACISLWLWALAVTASKGSQNDQ